MSRIENLINNVNCTPYESSLELIEYQTGSSVSSDTKRQISFFHSKLERFPYKRNRGRLENRLRDKKHIELDKYQFKINAQYESYRDIYEGISFEEIWSTSSEVISKLLSYSPTGFSAELTSEQSIFYTFKKYNNTLYLQYYFESEENGFNTTLVEYSGNEKIKSSHGELNEILKIVDLSMV